MAKISTRGTAVRDAIAARREFDTHGELIGRGTPVETGRLSADNRDRWKRERPTYAVYSYATPIAWWSEAYGWTVPPVKYSATTSRHQAQVRYALAGI